jgi:hypothetical protein
MKKYLGVLLLVVIVIIGIVVINNKNTSSQPAAAVLANPKGVVTTTTAVQVPKGGDIPVDAERKLRITVINGQCVYQVRNWLFGSWNIVQVSPYDTGVGACPGLQSVL